MSRVKWIYSQFIYKIDFYDFYFFDCFQLRCDLHSFFAIRYKKKIIFYRINTNFRSRLFQLAKAVCMIRANDFLAEPATAYHMWPFVRLHTDRLYSADVFTQQQSLAHFHSHVKLHRKKNQSGEIMQKRADTPMELNNKHCSNKKRRE